MEDLGLDSRPDPWLRFRKLAWITIVFGPLSLARLISEYLHLLSADVGRLGPYVWVLLLDIPHGALTLLSGIGLLRRRPWALQVTTVAAGAILADALLSLLYFGEPIWEEMFHSSMMRKSVIISALGSRLVMYLLQIPLWLYAANLLFRYSGEPCLFPDGKRRSRGRLLGLFFIVLTLAGFLEWKVKLLVLNK